jgi:CBS domain-containing protein
VQARLCPNLGGVHSRSKDAMKVEELMTRDVRTCGPDDNLTVPARLMWEGDCGCVPVVDREGRMMGMITDRDVCMAAYTRGERLEDMSVASVMSRDVRTCRRGDPLLVAQDTMRTAQVRRLPVIDTDERLVGVLSLNDLAREAVGDLAQRARDVTAQEIALTLAAVSLHRAGPQRELSPQAPPLPRRTAAGSRVGTNAQA